MSDEFTAGDVIVLDRPTQRNADSSSLECTRLVAANAVDAVAITGGTRETSAGESLAGDTITKASSEKKHSLASDLLELTKPRIVMMILIVTAISAVVAGGSAMLGWTMVHLLVGTAMVAGSAGVLNQVIEKEIDRQMGRTRLRPLPDDRLGRLGATVFGLLLIVAGTLYLQRLVGSVPALVGVATWIVYVVLYTPMKTRTSWNTTVGAISGALPMQIGYTAAGGGIEDLQGWLLCAVLFLWQYPHFMAIAWMYRRDYGAAGLRMSTVVDPSGRSAGWQAVVGTIVLAIVLLVLVLELAAEGWWRYGFALAAVAVTTRFIVAAVRFARQRDDQTARQLLRASLVQLPAAMVVLMLAALVGQR